MQKPEQKKYFVKKNPDSPKVAKKIKKFNQFDEKHKILEIGEIQNIDNPKFHKKLKIKIKYRNNDGKIKSKTIRFGDERKKNFVDTKDESIKKKINSRLARGDNFLHENFWRLRILNGNSTSKEENLKNLRTNIL